MWRGKGLPADACLPGAQPSRWSTTTSRAAGGASPSPSRGRDPVLVWTGSQLLAARSDGEPVALINALDSKDTILLEGLRGEVYTIKLGDATPVRAPAGCRLARRLPASRSTRAACAQVDLSNPTQLVQYFADPNWDVALQRTGVDIGRMQSAGGK